MNALEKKRLTKDISREALAEKLGITRQAMWLWETGRSLPEPGRYTSYAKALGVSTEELVEMVSTVRNEWLASLEAKKLRKGKAAATSSK